MLKELSKFPSLTMRAVIFEVLSAGDYYCVYCWTPTKELFCSRCDVPAVSRGNLIREARRRRLLTPTGLMRL